MILQFIKTKIGMSIVVAIIFIVTAIGIKVSEGSARSTTVSEKVSLIADASVKEGLKGKGTNLEDALNLLNGTTTDATLGTVDTKIVTADSEENITATDRFARALFTKYTAAKKNGRAIDATTQQDIAESVLSQDYSGDKTLLSEKDFKITSDTSINRAKTYGNALGTVLSKPRLPGDQELLILERIREVGIDDTDAKSLISILNRYQTMIKRLTTMTVPSGAVSGHADIVNGIGYLADGVDGILRLSSDPIGSLTKIKRYEDGINLMTSGALKLKKYFVAKNIVFSSIESGYGLTQ